MNSPVFRLLPYMKGSLSGRWPVKQQVSARSEPVKVVFLFSFC